MSDRRLRQARPADRPALEWLQESLAEPSPSLLECSLDTTVGFDNTSRVQAGRVLVADGGGPSSSSLIGYILTIETDGGIHVAELVVAPAHRRNGHGRALLRAVIDDNSGPVTVLVSPDNEPARRLYESVGFTVEKRIPAAFSEGDALRMRLP